MERQPAFYDDLNEALAQAWRLLARGTADRRSGFHILAVATTGLDGAPKLRGVVLRGAEPGLWRLRFHTDARSAKAAELARDPAIALLGYDATAKIQIRIEGRGTLHGADAVADAAWAGSRPFSRACYGTQPGPGTAIEAGGGFSLPAPEELESGREHFCAVVVAAHRLEWLYLAAAGHRRAAFARAEDGVVTGGWLAP